MVCIATYDDNGNVIGCTRADGVSGGLEFLAGCEDLGFTVTYKTPADLDAIAAQKIEDAKPKVISRVQAMKAMKQTGTLWADFNALLAANQDAKDEWDLATELQRNHTFTLQLSPALGLTSADLDNLFQLASTL